MHRTASSFRPRVEKLEDRTTPSTTALTVAPNPSIVGNPITLTAVVTEGVGDGVQPGGGDARRGTVQFLDGSTSLGTLFVTPSSTIFTQGSAQLTTSALGVGTHSLTARYSGDSSSFSLIVISTAGSTSSAVTEVVNPLIAPDVTALVKVSTMRLPGDEALVMVKDKAGRTISGPLYLEITGLPKTVKLLTKHGITHAHRPRHSPFVTDNVTLGPGGFIGFLLQFSGKASFGVRVLEGPGAV
jgi:hypothetical protein